MKTLDKKSISQLKKILWRYFSLYIRQRDADDKGMVKCFTCGKALHYKEAHASHYRSRQHSATLFNEQNVQPSCPRCNTHLRGNLIPFGFNLDKKYGKGTAERLYYISQQTKKYTPQELKDLIYYYKKLT